MPTEKCDDMEAFVYALSAPETMKIKLAAAAAGEEQLTRKRKSELKLIIKSQRRNHKITVNKALDAPNAQNNRSA